MLCWDVGDGGIREAGRSQKRRPGLVSGVHRARRMMIQGAQASGLTSCKDDLGGDMGPLGYEQDWMVGLTMVVWDVGSAGPSCRKCVGRLTRGRRM